MIAIALVLAVGPFVLLMMVADCLSRILPGPARIGPARIGPAHIAPEDVQPSRRPARPRTIKPARP